MVGKEREQWTDLFRLPSQLDREKAFFWKESFKSTYMNDKNRVTLLSLLSVEDPRIRQMENDGEDGKDIRRRIIGEDDIEKDSIGVVELEKITPVEEKAYRQHLVHLRAVHQLQQAALHKEEHQLQQAALHKEEHQLQ